MRARLGLGLPFRGQGGLLAAIKALFTAGEQGAWYDPSDFSTLYQDAAGTLPVTALGQPVGLMLDKRFGRGPELVTNGTFDTDIAGWLTNSAQTTIAHVNGRLYAESNGVAAVRPNTSIALVAGKVYEVSGTIENLATSVAIARLYVNATTSTTGSQQIGGSVPPGETATVRQIITARVGDATLFANTTEGAGAGLYLDNISVRELPGNHASQPTATARPTVQARVNLLSATQAFDDAVWVKGAGIAVTANTTVAPDGTLTADTIGTSAASQTFYHLAAVAPGQQLTMSVYVKLGTMQAGDFRFAVWDATNSAWILVASNPAQTLSASEWVRVSHAFTVPPGCTSLRIYPYTNSSVALGTVHLWGAQLELGSTPTTYQRVTSATDYADVGAPRYLQFDGVDDFLVTGDINFTATDKMTMWAGVRKESDAATGIICELGTSSFGVDGTAALIQSSSSSYTFQTRGTTAAANRSSATYAAPSTNVLQCSFDHSGSGTSALAQIRPRVDAVEVTGFSGTGAGNYANLPLYLGRRAGTTFPFKGNLYGLVIRGAQSTLAQIQTVERWTASKARITL